jgi:hypothetical protein
MRDMTRAETAQYITHHWFPCSPKTLAKLAVIGGGPAFRKAGRVPLYSEASADGWAESRIGPLVRSTTELAVARGAKPHGSSVNDCEFLELNDATPSRSLRHRMDRLLADLDAVTDADGAWFAERPGRTHRVREITKAEKAWMINATEHELTVPPGRRLYVAVKQVRRGVRMRLPFTAAPLHPSEEFSDTAAKLHWDQAAKSRPQVHEIEEGLRQLEGREP